MFGIVRLTAVALVALAADSLMGGWAISTVENPPDALEVGAPYRFQFVVRGHGVAPLSGLEPTLELRQGSGTATRVRAIPGSGAGRYQAEIVAREAGPLTVVLRSGFGDSKLTLLPIAVVARGAARPAMSAPDRGRHYFVASGCVTCHLNGDIPESDPGNRKLTFAPDLTGRQLDAGYVRQRITDPASLPRIGTGGPMPALGLSQPVVDAIVAFLSAPKQAASR